MSDMPQPHTSYTIWFSQRTGSSLLCDALTSTGIAGNPNEWLNPGAEQELFEQFGVSTVGEFQEQLWTLGSSSNGVFGLKVSVHEPFLTDVVNTLRKLPGCPSELTRAEVWNYAFPNHHHIFMTRRNKVRLAVSWWKAVQTQQWHRQRGEPVQAHKLSLAYDFEAINQLYSECSMREAAIESFLSEVGVAPLTLVYEDFILEFEKTIRSVLRFLGLGGEAVSITSPGFSKLADDVSEAWVQRFRADKQKGWTNRAW